MDRLSRAAITPRESRVGTVHQPAISILTPTNMSTPASPYLSRRKRAAMLARRKYRARRPRMAKMLEEATMKGSVVTAKTAGMESTANMASLMPIRTTTRNRGVNQRLPSRMTARLSPWYWGRMGRWRRIQRTRGWCSGSGSRSSLAHTIWAPV